MPNIRDLQLQPRVRTEGRRYIILNASGVLTAFIFGAIAVWSWSNFLPPREQVALTASLSSHSAPSFGGDRIGRAETAPLLSACLTPNTLDIARDHDVDPKALYKVLTIGDTFSRVRALLGARNEKVKSNLATNWGAVADCVYRQNRWHLCDADNRAFAIEAVNSFVRHANEPLAHPANFGIDSIEASRLSQSRDRVLDALRRRLRSGELIASDFGPLTPAPVRGLLNEIKPIENGCAKG